MEAVPMRIYAYIAAALALIGAAIYVNQLQKKASRVDAAEARAEAAENQVTAERAARAHEQRIAKEASDGYQSDLKRLETERTAPDPVVRLCKRAAASVPTGGSAATGPDAAGATDHVEAAQTDIGPALMDYGIACEANALQLTRLQEWIRAR
jgi:Flp pilus assembly protein TadB